MNPLEDAIVALRPIALVNMPFKMTNSSRLLDPTLPQGTTAQFTGIDPNGTPITVTNSMTNFGGEYVWHCHLLGHEENDMMRPIAAAVPPPAPTTATLAVVGNGLRITWTNNALNATGIIIQRATNNAFTAGLTTFNASSATATTYTDTTAATGTTYYYRVIATSTVGSTASGYPTITANSNPSNTVSGAR
jgi:hypothetical protein